MTITVRAFAVVACAWAMCIAAPSGAAREPIVRAGTVLIECEKPVRTNFAIDTLDPAFCVQRDSAVVARGFERMSGGAGSLLCTRRSPDSAYQAEYEFVAPKAALMHLWVFEQGRAWASPFEWSIDDSVWHGAPSRLPMERWTRLADDGPTFVWVRLGAIQLTAGAHRLKVRVTQPRPNGRFLLAQDCFAFVLPTGPSQGRPFEYTYEGPTASSVMLWDSLPPSASPESGFLPWMDPYLVPAKVARGAVVVFPGGAYVGRAPTEGVSVARRFNKEGYHAFVVYYRTAPNRHPAPLQDASRAVRIVRSRAAEWSVRADRIAVCGFSAGGHLAASLGVHAGKWQPQPPTAIDSVSSRPDALILCYPVISFGEMGHEGSMRNLLGDKPDPALVKVLSLETQVSATTPPTFLWHTAPDGVKVENSLMFAAALSKARVPFEIHVYHQGPHGLNIAENDPHVATWVSLCSEWLAQMQWK